MVSAIPQLPKKGKKSFSSFTYTEAMKHLGLTELQPWELEAEPIPLSDFFKQRLARLERFDLKSLEVSKTLLIDAICEEGLEGLDLLKVWKGPYLEGEDVCGNADYLLAKRLGYLEAPFVCVIEAKKDDFEQGTAQCLVEMQACRWSNQQLNNDFDIYGIVTNGQGWQFYRLDQAGKVSETLLSGISDLPRLLGRLRKFFSLCEANLRKKT